MYRCDGKSFFSQTLCLISYSARYTNTYIFLFDVSMYPRCDVVQMSNVLFELELFPNDGVARLGWESNRSRLSAFSDLGMNGKSIRRETIVWLIRARNEEKRRKKNYLKIKILKTRHNGAMRQGFHVWSVA